MTMASQVILLFLRFFPTKQKTKLTETKITKPELSTVVAKSIINVLQRVIRRMNK